MFPNVAMCGKPISFLIPRRRVGLWALVILVVLALLAIALRIASRALMMTPIFLVLFNMRRNRPRTIPKPRWIKLAMHSIVVEGVTIQLNGVRFLEKKKRAVVLRLKRNVRVTVDLRSLATPMRNAFVRQLEARHHLSINMPRQRAEQIALEAFYVYDAHAVLMHKRFLLEILPEHGPFPQVGQHERIYVREMQRVANPYRDAMPNVIAIGSIIVR